MQGSERPVQRINAAGRLIVALDFPTVEEARAVVRELGDAMSFYKIGLHLQLARGLYEFAEELAASGKRIFLDFKYIDISDTITGVIARASEMSIEFVTVYQSPVATAAAVRARNGATPKILTVTLLTDRDQAYVKAEYNSDVTPSEYVVGKAALIERIGGDGVICSPNEAAAIRRAAANPDFLIVTPGIRPEWSDIGGHKRPGTPTHAVAAGADYLVVGRPIVRAADRAIAARRIVEEMQAAFDAR